MWKFVTKSFSASFKHTTITEMYNYIILSLLKVQIFIFTSFFVHDFILPFNFKMMNRLLNFNRVKTLVTRKGGVVSAPVQKSRNMGGGAKKASTKKWEDMSLEEKVYI